MKKTIPKILIAALALLSSVCLPVAVYAEEEEETATPSKWIQVSPAAVTVTMQGGDVLEGDSDRCIVGQEYGCHIEVKNIGSEAFRFRMYVTPHVVVGSNNEVDFTASDSTYSQIVRWIALGNAQGGYDKEVYYQLNPDQSVTVPFRVTVPEDVPGGMQQAAVWAEVVSDGNSGGTGVNTVARAATVIAGRSIGNTRQTAEVSDASFERFALKGPLTAHASVKNTGNTDFTAHYSYTAKTFFGKVLGDGDINGEIAAYPGIEYPIDITWENPPYLGIFQVEFNITAADANYSERHIVAILPIPIIVLLILLLTVIIIWIIIIIRKRKERKARLLV